MTMSVAGFRTLTLMDAKTIIVWRTWRIHPSVDTLRNEGRAVGAAIGVPQFVDARVNRHRTHQKLRLLP